MKSNKINIELFENSEKVNFYTLRFVNENTEVDKFLDKFPEGSEYDEDISIIIKWIDTIGERGAHERYFRREGKMGDDVMAMPTPIETSKLRLYVIRLSEEVVILGNGGLKTTRTYNEDPILNECVKLLQEIDRFIKSRPKTKTIKIDHKELRGDLTFYLKEKQDEK
ncbi:hypothetical protein K4L44_17685 [Halosquirtibacter laminarini]|uniref:Uncharacterized protein n=1 Tax=Halosquirtibacter laminarini TaxID=3374600 RepID=A0AC61NFC8_9BACT|nr:hypothetical protein K4L44_17685 [Prolixibacteraceae bacterium]